MLNIEALARLHRKVKQVASTPPKPHETLFLFGQTLDNQVFVLDTAARYPGTIVIPGGPPDADYPGAKCWREVLRHLGRYDGIREATIVQDVDSHDGESASPTLLEAKAIVRDALQHGTKRVIIMAPQWHLLRCFMMTLGIAMKDYPSLEIQPTSCDPGPWTEDTMRRHGTSCGARVDIGSYESIQILRHHGWGHLPDPELGLKHLERLT